jgi:hypothetical protein
MFQDISGTDKIDKKEQYVYKARNAELIFFFFEVLHSAKANSYVQLPKYQYYVLSRTVTFISIIAITSLYNHMIITIIIITPVTSVTAVSKTADSALREEAQVFPSRSLQKFTAYE